MKQTLQLTQITDKWLIVLQNSAQLNDYCIAEYGKKPTIFVGLNPKDTISEQFLPAIVIYPIGKIEGLNKEQYTYTMFCGWDILHKGTNEADGVVELDGMKKSDELGQLLYRTLSVASQDNPISTIRYELDTAWAPRWPGWFYADIDIYPPIGGFPMEY
jgi:hypothetical protein